MSKSGTIIIVDDNKGVLTAVQILLKNYFSKVVTLSSPVTLTTAIREETPEVVLLDMNFTSGINTGNEGLFWLHEIKKVRRELPVVLFTAYADIDLAIRGIKEGASDFIVKPWNNQKLVETLQAAASSAQQGRKTGNKKEPVNTPALYWGESKSMQQLRTLIEKVASTDANILITGENGTGKSTMMKLLYGLYDFDGGDIKIKGENMSHITPKIAIEKGIGMVHQEFMLVSELTVLENIILGFEPRKGCTIDFDKAKNTVQHYIDQYGMDIQMSKKINQISVGEAQRVEIIKILTRGADVIILDEPTAVLTPQETRRLFEILENLRKDGKSIVFISHKLNEVMEISDRITVMRQGCFIGTVDKQDTSPSDLARMMIGREVFLDIKKEKADIGDVVLEVKDLWTSGEKEISKIRGVSMEVRAGEIVGIAGIDGNGQSEFIEAITGLRKVEKGCVILGGTEITNFSPKKSREAGLAHIPEDRNTRGLNRTMTIRENLVAVQEDKAPFAKGIMVNDSASYPFAKEMAEKFDIRPRDTEIPTSSLSGGNAQKVVVAREVSIGGKLLVASQPTRGVDIGAIESIRTILQDVKKKGLGVLLVSADLEEIMSLSDRIVVMYEGRITGRMMAEEADEEKLGLLMMGGHDMEGCGIQEQEGGRQ